MLRVEIFHIFDHLFPIEQTIEEMDQQFLVGSSAENTLEPEIGKQTDVSFFYSVHILRRLLSQKYEVFLKRQSFLSFLSIC